MGNIPRGVAGVVDGDVNNGTERRIYPTLENWKIYNYQFI